MTLRTVVKLTCAYVLEEVTRMCAWPAPDTFTIQLPAGQPPAVELQSCSAAPKAKSHRRT